jgi:uncharacterized glyoxalase superfamily protein PhnB
MTTSTDSVPAGTTGADDRPAPTVWPSVGFRDVDAGITFLTEGLGFAVTACYRGADGTVEHAEARWPDGGGVMFGSRGKPGDWGALGPAGVYVVAADPATVDAALERVRGLPGVTVLRELNDTDYGSHEFGVRDADGNLWTLGTYRGA